MQLGDWLQTTRAIGPNGIQTYSDNTNEKKERIEAGKLKRAIETGEVIKGEEGRKVALAILSGDINSRATTPSKAGSRGNSPNRGRSPNRSRGSPRKPGSPGSPNSSRPNTGGDVENGTVTFDASLFAEGSLISTELSEVPEYLKIIAGGMAAPDTEIAAGTTALI